jgi:hypothetical protein
MRVWGYENIIFVFPPQPTYVSFLNLPLGSRPNLPLRHFFLLVLALARLLIIPTSWSRPQPASLPQLPPHSPHPPTSSSLNHPASLYTLFQSSHLFIGLPRGPSCRLILSQSASYLFCLPTSTYLSPGQLSQWVIPLIGH